jgi:hypothetical protein
MRNRQHSSLGPRRIDDSAFSGLQSREEQLDYLMRLALLAPASGATQPGAFRNTGGGFEVYADYSRRMPLGDPHDRELLMSVGAAITRFRVTAACHGFDLSVSYTPGREQCVPVAHLAVRPARTSNESLMALSRSIRRRQTTPGWTFLRQRSPSATLEEGPIDPAAAQSICDVLDRFPERLQLASSQPRRSDAQLIDFASRGRQSSVAGRVEPSNSIPSGVDELRSGESACLASLIAGPWLSLPLDARDVLSSRNGQPVRSAPTLILLTSEDDRASLIQAGEMLEHLLLVVITAGLQFSLFNHPIELEELLEKARITAASKRQPQVLVRIIGAPLPLAVTLCKQEGVVVS